MERVEKSNIKILFLLDELYPNTSANSRIVYRIIDELLKNNKYAIKILGRPLTDEQKRINEYKGCEVIHEPYYKWESAIFRADNTKSRNRFRNIFRPKIVVYTLLRFFSNLSPFEFETVCFINRMVKRKEVDVIVACSMPFYTLFVAARFGKSVPVVYYKMEPFSTIHSRKENELEEAIKTEIWLDDKAAKILATDLTYKEYEKSEIKKNIHKVVVANFPNILENRALLNNSHVQFKKDHISCVFVGKLYPTIRNPKFLFDLVELLPDDLIHLHIIGGINDGKFDDEFFETYLKNEHKRISYYGEVSPSDADALLNQADILVHIGNSFPNSMPSKILDYISSGKPIINIHKVSNCPTLPYLEKYPLCLNIYENDGLSESVVNSYYQFCIDNRGKKVPFNDIKEIYYDSTPEFVGEIFENTIKDLVVV